MLWSRLNKHLGAIVQQSRSERDERRLLSASAFSPAIAHWELSQNPGADGVSELKPAVWVYDTALLFVDISGFTNLCTRLPIDALQKHINSYFTALIDKIVSMGGDILRFAGDAILCSWSLRTSESGKIEAHQGQDTALAHAAQAACRCAIELQEECGSYEIPEINAVLSIHSGVGVGTVNAFRVGTAQRWEFLIAGQVLDQIAAAEGCAESGEAVCSPEVWSMVSSKCTGTPKADPMMLALSGRECVLLLQIKALENSETFNGVTSLEEAATVSANSNTFEGVTPVVSPRAPECAAVCSNRVAPELAAPSQLEQTDEQNLTNNNTSDVCSSSPSDIGSTEGAGVKKGGMLLKSRGCSA